jgi:hypothetical protein
MAPPSIEALAADLMAAYSDAWRRIRAEQASIAADPTKWRRRARLNDLEAAIVALMDDVDGQARDWLERTYPGIYIAGAEASSAAVGQAFTWTLVHRDALAALAQDTFDDLLAASRHVRRTTKLLIRELARSETFASLTTGKTPDRAARDLRALLAEKGIFAVTYKDGSRHGLGEYADVVLRTRTATAYNAGTVNQARSLGTEYFEVFDGDACGWRTHDAKLKANGLIVTAQEAADFPVAHPRCRRAFGPRPDIRSAEEAAAAGPTTTDAQRQDQATFERRRADTLHRAAVRRQRIDRRQQANAARRPPPVSAP